MTVKMDLRQWGRLAGDLERAAGRVLPAARIALSKTAHDIEADAKVLCPVDFGTLRSSIGTEIQGLTARVGATAEYALFVEEGTSTQAPQAFLGPAFDRRIGGLDLALGQIGASLAGGGRR